MVAHAARNERPLRTARTDQRGRPTLAKRVEVAIKQQDGRREGAEIRFLCPAHNDDHPSARWNPKKKTWYCDVCGTGGGCVDLAKRLGVHSAGPKRRHPAQPLQPCNQTENKMAWISPAMPRRSNYPCD